MKRKTQIALSGVLLVVETAVAAGVFFGAAFGLTRLAEYRHGSPIVADRGGVVTLPPTKATLRGGLELFPTEWESRTEGYSNEYGRALAEERMNRKIGNWKSLTDAAGWDFFLHSGGDFRVEVELAAPPEEAGSKIEVRIGPQTVRGTVPDTGGWTTWKIISLGEVALDAGGHTLTIQASSIGHERAMNVARVTLRPAE